MLLPANHSGKVRCVATKLSLPQSTQTLHQGPHQRPFYVKISLNITVPPDLRVHIRVPHFTSEPPSETPTLPIAESPLTAEDPPKSPPYNRIPIQVPFTSGLPSVFPFTSESQSEHHSPPLQSLHQNPPYIRRPKRIFLTSKSSSEFSIE